MCAEQVAIIYVPGIRPKPRPELHQAQLRRCLEAGLKRIGAADEDATAIAESLLVVGWSHGFYGEHKLISTDMKGIERLLRFADSPDDDVREATALSRRVVSWFYALADYFPVLGTTFSTRRMKTRVEEINRYFADSDGEAASARAMLKHALCDAWAADKRILLIGHSFGSVIAYDTLWEMSRLSSGGDGLRLPPGKQVDLFMTMGSPLTMHYINSHLKGSGSKGAGRYPEGIKRWINLAARGEVTALDRKLSHRFADMRKHGLLESIEDDLNVIGQFRDGDFLNVHKCYGYMASTEVGRLIRDWYSRRRA